MASFSLKTFAILALPVSQPALGATFPSHIFGHSEMENMPLEKRASMVLPSNFSKLWYLGEIPYILQGLPHDLSDTIRSSMRAWEQSTCIRFLPKTNQGAWMKFKKNDGDCNSGGLGSPGLGERVVNLDYPNAWEQILYTGARGKLCFESGIIIHELGHVIGLVDEQQRPDRDKYVRILWERIDEEKLDNFSILNVKEVDAHLPFDYNSVMLLDRKAFAKRTLLTPIVGAGSLKHTMETNTANMIEPWSSPTPNDFKAVNDAYGCEEYYTRVIPDCLPGSIPADGDISSYSFIIDNHTEAYMRANGYTHLAAHQNCRSNMINQDTDNWGFTPLNGWGPRAPYNVVTNRCKKDFARHASRYEVALCKGDNEGACDIKCGLRRVCPYDASGNQVDNQAIDVVDDNLWICHPH